MMLDDANLRDGDEGMEIEGMEIEGMEIEGMGI